MFGNSVLATRLLSAIFSILTFPILYLSGKEIKDENFGLIIVFLYSISPFSIFYANEVRAYSLIHLLFSISIYLAIKCLKSPNNLRNYFYHGVIGALLIYTHYMGFLYYGIILIGMSIFNRKENAFIKRILLSLIISITSYIPWIPYAIQDSLGGAHGYAGGRLNFVNLSYWAFTYFLAPVPSYINNPYVMNLIIFTFLINIPLMILSVISLIGFINICMHRANFKLKVILRFVIIISALLYGSSILIGLIIENSFTSKNLIGGLSLIYILEAFGLYYLFIEKNSFQLKYKKTILKFFNLVRSKKIIYSIISALLIINMVIYPIFRAYYLQKPDWNGCFERLKKDFKKHDIIILGYPGKKYSDVMEYYSDLNDFDLEDNFYILNYEDEDEIEEFIEDIYEDNITRIWIIKFWKNIRDPNGKTDDLLVEEYDLEEIEEYKYRLDIKLTLYEVP
jgi:uncharacterized membrane protein